MAPSQVVTAYKQLQQAFTARPSDPKKCASLLADLKVRMYTLARRAIRLTTIPGGADSLE